MRRTHVEHAVVALAKADDVVRLERVLDVGQPLDPWHAVDGPRLRGGLQLQLLQPIQQQIYQQLEVQLLQ